MGKLTGKVAVVTGASKGIGAAIAQAYAADGASVVVNYASSKAGADRVVAEIAKIGGKSIAVQGDMSKLEDIQRLFAETCKTFGRLDILVNNAGVYEFLPLDQVTPEHFHKQFNLNVLGLILASQEASKQFGDNGGVIINNQLDRGHCRTAVDGRVQRDQRCCRYRHESVGQGTRPAKDPRQRA